MAEIHLLTLNLYYYYLHKGLNVTGKKVAHFDSYWQKYQEKYPKNEDGSLSLIHPEFEGTLHHIKNQLEDTNVFLLDCSVKASNMAKSDVISQLKKQIHPPKHTKVSLGYTWMIYGWGKFEEQDIETLYEKLVDEKDGKVEETSGKWDFQRRGNILGATVVEAWKSAREWDVPQIGSHVLIILYTNEETYINASNMLHEAWIPLLWYRHKIWHSYQESRDSKEKILSAFNKSVPEELKDYEKYDLSSLKEFLEQNLKTLTSYSIGLNNINIHQQTLSTNSYNYTLAVRDFFKLADKCKTDSLQLNNSKFLEEFSKITKIKYKKQLERDYATLAPGLAVLTGLTETIRGLVEVQQAEIDQQQNITIAIVGLGLSASSAAVGISATQVYQPENNQRISWQDGLVYSVAPAIVIGISLILVSTKDWYKKFQKLKQAESTKLISSEKD